MVPRRRTSRRCRETGQWLDAGHHASGVEESRGRAGPQISIATRHARTPAPWACQSPRPRNDAHGCRLAAQAAMPHDPRRQPTNTITYAAHHFPRREPASPQDDEQKPTGRIRLPRGALTSSILPMHKPTLLPGSASRCRQDANGRRRSAHTIALAARLRTIRSLRVSQCQKGIAFDRGRQRPPTASHRR